MKCLACWKEARFLRHFHAAMTILWVALVPITLLTGMKASLPWIAFMSVWSNVMGHWSSWQGARAEEAASG